MEPVKMTGDDPDITVEDLKKLFNREVYEGSRLNGQSIGVVEGIEGAGRVAEAYNNPGMGYYYKAVKDMTEEETADHIELLRRCSIRIRIAQQAAKNTLDAKKIKLGKEQQEALRIRESQYKPKPVPKEGSEKIPRKAKAATQPKDAVESLMALLGISREKAEKRMKRLALIADDDGSPTDSKEGKDPVQTPNGTEVK